MNEIQVMQNASYAIAAGFFSAVILIGGSFLYRTFSVKSDNRREDWFERRMDALDNGRD